MKRFREEICRLIIGGGVHRVKRSPTATSPELYITYVRSGPRTATPTVVIPGGPGLGSVLPYSSLRRLATRGQLDLILIEHRGVGFSGKDSSGTPLTHDAMWVTEVLDDIAAVLDNEQVEQAFIAGSSYGSYLTFAFGARHPNRIAGMLIDSALQSTADVEIERARIRELFVEGEAEVAKHVRSLSEDPTVDNRLLLDTIRAAFELGGWDFLRGILRNRTSHKSSLTWCALERYATRDESITRVPGFFEFGIAGAIGFRELDYASAPDGDPLDPALTYAALQPYFPEYLGEPYNLVAEAAEFSWPMVFIVGAFDVRTPPAVAQRAAESVPQATTVVIQNGHSALDTHPVAFLNVLRFLVTDQAELLPRLSPRIDALPKRGLSARLAQLLVSLCRAETVVRRVLPSRYQRS